jgi:ADP-ribosylglycohydrolase
MLYYYYLVWIVITALVYAVLVQLLPPAYRKSNLTSFIGNDVTHTNALSVALVSMIALFITLLINGMQFTEEEEKEGFTSTSTSDEDEKEKEKKRREQEAKEKKEKLARLKKEKESS